MLEDWEVGEQMETKEQRFVKGVATILKKTSAEEKGSLKGLEKCLLLTQTLILQENTSIKSVKHNLD